MATVKVLKITKIISFHQKKKEKEKEKERLVQNEFSRQSYTYIDDKLIKDARGPSTSLSIPYPRVLLNFDNHQGANRSISKQIVVSDKVHSSFALVVDFNEEEDDDEDCFLVGSTWSSPPTCVSWSLNNNIFLARTFCFSLASSPTHASTNTAAIFNAGCSLWLFFYPPFLHSLNWASGVLYSVFEANNNNNIYSWEFNHQATMNEQKRAAQLHIFMQNWSREKENKAEWALVGHHRASFQRESSGVWKISM